MPLWHTIELKLTDQEFEQLSGLADKHRVSLTRFLKDAALAFQGQAEVKYSGHQLQHIYREAKSRKHIWTEQELREAGLPLYWSESWVRKQLAQGITPSQIAILCGANVRSVRSHINQYYHLQVYYKLTPKQVALIHERLQKGESRADIAVDLGISLATVGKYAKGFPSKADLLFEQRAKLIDHWPATTRQIADKLFEGNSLEATGWTTGMVKSGRLVRIKQGLFDLNPQNGKKSDAPS